MKATLSELPVGQIFWRGKSNLFLGSMWQKKEEGAIVSLNTGVGEIVSRDMTVLLATPLEIIKWKNAIRG